MKDTKIYPLQIGRVDWKIYVKVCQEFLGESPTRGIDSAGISLDNPIAFLKTLDFHNQPINAISQEHLYNHVFFSFIAITDIFTIAQISERGYINIAYVEKRNEVLVLMSGTLKQWKDSIVSCCDHKAESILRRFFNDIYLHFETAGFKEIWTEFIQTPKGDGTFALSRKR